MSGADAMGMGMGLEVGRPRKWKGIGGSAGNEEEEEDDQEHAQTIGDMTPGVKLASANVSVASTLDLSSTATHYQPVRLHTIPTRLLVIRSMLDVASGNIQGNERDIK